MCTQRLRLRVLRPKLGHQLAPQQPPGAQLGDLHEGVHGDAPEEGEAGGEFVHVKADIFAGANVFDNVGEGVGEFQVGGGTGFLDVVAGAGDGVEARHLHGGVFEDVGDDAHGGFWWVNVGITHHEFFEDVVLDGAREFFGGHSLFLGGNNVEGEDGEDGTVHGHGDGDVAQVDAFEELAHIQDGVNGHACHADVTNDTFVVGVVAAVCC